VKKIFIFLFVFCWISFVFGLISVSFAGQWHYSLEQDEMTDEKVGYAHTEAIKGQWLFQKYDLFVRCREKKPKEVFIVWHQFLNNDGVTVKVRFDKNAVEEYFCLPSSDGTATFFSTKFGRYSQSGALNIIGKIKKYSVMRAKTADFRGVPTETALFSLIGATKAIDKACSWHYDVFAVKQGDTFKVWVPGVYGPIVEGFKNCDEVMKHAQEYWPDAKVKCPASKNDF